MNNTKVKLLSSEETLERTTDIVVITNKGVEYRIISSMFGGIMVKCMDNSSLVVVPESGSCVSVQSIKSLTGK